MVSVKDFSSSNSWKQRARRGGIYVAVAALIGSQTACSDSQEAEQSWEEVKVQEPTKGVVTTIQEEADGEFAIIDERVVEKNTDSRLIIKRLSGVTDTLTLDQAKGLVGTTDTVVQHQATTHHRSGLGNVIWWGSMGYMMGRNFNTPVQPYVYRDASTSSGAAAGGAYRGYSSGSRVANDLRTTSTTRTQMRPVSGKSGYFGSGSRSSGRTYGG